MTVNGLNIIAIRKDGSIVEQFGITFINGMAFGYDINNWYSTDRELCQLVVL